MSQLNQYLLIANLVVAIGLPVLAIVIYKSSFFQRKFLSPQYFIRGVELITAAIRNKDTTTALRLIEYYSRLALKNDGDELFLILNTVLCGDVRKQLESPNKNISGNYPFAVTAVAKIGQLLKEQSLKRKGITPNVIPESYVWS